MLLPSPVERAAMRGRVDAERQAAHDRESGCRQRARESSRVGDALRRRVAAADDGERGPREELPPAHAIEDGRGVADLEQAPRIVGVVERDEVMSGASSHASAAARRFASGPVSTSFAGAAATTLRRCAGVAATTASGLPNARSSSASERGPMPQTSSRTQASARASTFIGRRAPGAATRRTQGLRT